MRISELRSRISDYFSDPVTYSQDIIHSELGGITVNDAITRGDEPDEIWKAVVRHNPDMPAKYR
jgi:hypothetical protein